VPQNVIHQEEMRRRAHEVSPDFSSLDTIYFNSGVSTRHFCEPTERYTVPRTWEERTASFTHHAVDLLEDHSVNAIAAAALHVHRRRRADPRRAADEPPFLRAADRAPSDLRLWLRRWRRWPEPRNTPCARDPGRQRPVPYRRPLFVVSAHQRPAHRYVRCCG